MGCDVWWDVVCLVGYVMLVGCVMFGGVCDVWWGCVMFGGGV